MDLSPGADTTREQLRQHEFTKGLASSHMDALARICSEVTFRQDEVILVEGQRSHYFYLLLTGSVVVELHRPLFTVWLQAVNPGQAFGWSALLNEEDTLFQVRARENARALRLDGPTLAALCRSDAQLGYELLARALAIAAGRIRATEARFAELCGVQIARRLSPIDRDQGSGAPDTHSGE